jgi:hypothetical protein
MKKRVRSILLGASIGLALLAIAFIAVIHTQGNHAIGRDGSKLQIAASIAMSVLASGTTVLLAVVVANCKVLLGTSYGKIARVAVPMLLIAELTTLFWLRGGMETFRTAKDTTNQASAIEVAWKTEESARLADLEAARQIPASVTEADAAAQAIRDRIARETALAQNMDNDGDSKNDRLIPGQLALVESLKADLANLDARADKARVEHGAAISAATVALAAHRETRADLAQRVALATDNRHQLDRWADSLVALVPSLTRAQAQEIAMLAVCLPLMAFLYAGLTGINAALAIDCSEPAAEVAIKVEESTPAPVEEPAPGRIIQFEIAPPPGLPRDRDAMRAEVRHYLRQGFLDDQGIRSTEVSGKTVRELEDLIQLGQHRLRASFLGQRTA